jgi:hypothetical protein
MIGRRQLLAPAALLKAEIDKWGPIIKAAAITIRD